MRVRLVHAVVICSVALLVLLCCWANLLGDPVNERNFRRVEVGMTERQVEAVLGGGQEALDPVSTQECLPVKDGWPVKWHGDMYSVVVWFGEDGRVRDKSSYEWMPMRPWERHSTVEKVLRFLRLENGPPRGLGQGGTYNGRPVEERFWPFVFALLAIVGLATVMMWILRRHRPGVSRP